MPQTMRSFGNLSGRNRISPYEFGKVFGWWNFNELSTITKDGSNNITQINDMLGSGVNFATYSTFPNPVYTTNSFSGRATGRFNRTTPSDPVNGSRLTAGAAIPSTLAGQTIFIFGQHDALDNQIYYSQHYISTTGNFFVGRTTSVQYTLITTSGRQNLTTAAFADNSYQIITVRYDGANQTIFRNGYPVASLANTGTINNNGQNLLVGAYNDNAAGYVLNGNIGEVIHFREALSDTAILMMVERCMRPYWNYTAV